jgi:hypothetical protein
MKMIDTKALCWFALFRYLTRPITFVLAFGKKEWSLSNGDYQSEGACDKAEEVLYEAGRRAMDVVLQLEIESGMKEAGTRAGSRARSTITGLLGERFRCWKVKADTKFETLYESQINKNGYLSKQAQSKMGDFFKTIRKTATSIMSPGSKTRPKIKQSIHIFT